jgi:hypothetical protein
MQVGTYQDIVLNMGNNININMVGYKIPALYSRDDNKVMPAGALNTILN